jgi:PIN like domain
VPPDEAVPRQPVTRKLDDVRFYVDEDIIGFGYAMMWARTDTVTCGADVIASILPRQIPDVDWIPIVASKGWVAITGNRRIRENPVEALAAHSSAARIVCVHDKRGALPT